MRTKRYTSSISATLHDAINAGMTYGQYVARTEQPVVVVHAAKPKYIPSAWTSPQRTLYESLNQELKHADTRAAWLGDIVVTQPEPQPKSKPIGVSMEEQRKMVELFERGYSRRSIALMSGRAKSTVNRVIKEWSDGQWTTE